MGDGEYDATLGRRRTSGAGSDSHRVTPNPRLAAAPWERFSAPEPDNGAHLWQAAAPPVKRDVEPPAERVVGPQIEPTNRAPAGTKTVASHTNGAISVADLLAKMGAPMPDRPSHHHVAPDTESSEPGDRPDDQLDTQVIDMPAYSLDLASELPDLGTLGRPTTRPTTTTTSKPHAPTPPRHPSRRAGQNRSGSAGVRFRSPRDREGPREKTQILPPDAAGRAVAGGSVCGAGPGHDRRGLALEQLEERPPQIR